jgi:hypothetical protein
MAQTQDVVTRFDFMRSDLWFDMPARQKRGSDDSLRR